MEKYIFLEKSYEDLKKQHITIHRHNSIELLHVLKGSINCLIEGNLYSIPEKTICMINQKKLHGIYSTQKDCRFQCLRIEPSFFTSDREIYRKYIEPVLTDSGCSHVISSAGHVTAREISNLMEAVGDLDKFRPDAYELTVVGLVHMIFQRLYVMHKAYGGSRSEHMNTDILLYRKMADYIYMNYDRPMSLDDIAFSGNVSRSKCCIIFKKYGQSSPINFLNMYRLEVSAMLLRTTYDSIASVALSCGFGQPSYYDRLFFKIYEMTPGEYRARYREIPDIS